MRASSLLASLIAGSAALISSASAGPVTIPNTFVAGTAAKAADVNANFSAVATAVNGSATDISNLQTAVQALQAAPAAGPVVVSVAGTAIGPLIEAEHPCVDTNFPGACGGNGIAVLTMVMSSAGFFVYLNPGQVQLSPPMTLLPEGTIAVPTQMFFDQPNCTGNRYLGIGGYIQPKLRQGLVVGAIDPADTNGSYYAKGASVPLTTASYQAVSVSGGGALQTPSCTNGPSPLGSQLAFFLLTANNPATTGVPKAPSGTISYAVQ